MVARSEVPERKVGNSGSVKADMPLPALPSASSVNSRMWALWVHDSGPTCCILVASLDFYEITRCLIRERKHRKQCSPLIPLNERAETWRDSWVLQPHDTTRARWWESTSTRSVCVYMFSKKLSCLSLSTHMHGFHRHWRLTSKSTV